MSGVRRLAVLAVLVAAAGVALLLVPAPRRLAGPERVRGPAVLRVQEAQVRAVVVRLGSRTVAASRTPAGWVANGRSAPLPLAEALDALVAMLARLRAVHAFRAPDLAPFGLDAPRATVTVEGPRGARVLHLGRYDSAGSTIYARRDGDPRIFRVGVALQSALERVLYHAEQAERATSSR